MKNKNVLFNICGSVIEKKGIFLYSVLIGKDYLKFKLKKI